MTAHNHPILAKILELQANMRLSLGNRWSPQSNRGLTRHNLKLYEVLAGHGLCLFLPKADLACAGWLDFHETDEEVFNVITNSSKIYEPRACFNFLLNSS